MDTSNVVQLSSGALCAPQPQVWLKAREYKRLLKDDRQLWSALIGSDFPLLRVGI